LYAGYVDDEESIDEIMKKFEVQEEITKNNKGNEMTEEQQKELFIKTSNPFIKEIQKKSSNEEEINFLLYQERR
jgi:hypothetical protein